jgi:hypothetical protein
VKELTEKRYHLGKRREEASIRKSQNSCGVG